MQGEPANGDLVPIDHEPGRSVAPTALDSQARAELAAAMAALARRGGFVMRATELLGGVMGRGLRAGLHSLTTRSPLRSTTQAVAEAALHRAYQVALLRLHDPAEQDRSRRLARPLVLMSGAVGGFVGLGGLLPDITVTSLAIMREIGRIAQDEGEDLADPGTRAACLEVFALTAGNPADGEADMGYFSARLMMQGRPLAILMAEVAARFGVAVSQKFAVQAVPILGAVGGAVLNTAFLAHYRDVARAHFTVRRLERAYGAAVIEEATHMTSGNGSQPPGAPWADT